jgi:ribosomal protein S18 acetylase RimI-like enzyme
MQEEPLPRVVSSTSPSLDPFRDGDEGALLELELLASEPYVTFVYGDLERARHVDRVLLAQGVAEFAPPHCGFLRDSEGKASGLLAALPKEELARRRLQCAMTLSRQGLMDPGTARRLSLAARTLLRPGEGDYYLSRIAVRSDREAQGEGSLLMRQLLERARTSEAKRIVLEVSPRHERAMALYRRFGFESVDLRTVLEPETGRELAYHHMVCALC